MASPGAPPLCLPWVVAVIWAVTSPGVIGQLGDSAPPSPDQSEDVISNESFVFTSSVYNGTIYENTIGKAFIKSPQRMGILLEQPATVDVEYTIVGGDLRGVFMAETVKVKDFCFLRIRTQTLPDNYGMLNRELTSAFYLKVKARGSYGGETVMETFTDVIITVLDQNEFSPLFSSLPYEVSIPEDTPLYTSVAQVSPLKHRIRGFH